MAADGGWPGAAMLETPARGDAATRRSLDEIRAVLARLEERLARSEPEPLVAGEGAELASALAALGRRMEMAEAAADARFAELSSMLAVLADRLARPPVNPEPLQSAAQPIAFAEPGAIEPADPWPIRAVLLAASGAAALSVVGAVYLVTSAKSASPAPWVASAPASLPLRPALSSAARAIEPQSPAASLPDGAVAQPALGVEPFAEVARELERGGATALPRLAGLAERGNAAAQLHLASLYEVGAAGLPRDLAAARAWTARAAEAGDRIAMHNLALFLSNGDGGPRDLGQAVRWFRKAAESGVVDSQHNLGLMYSAGRGVERNLSEAYRWFSIAAEGGDALSREKAVEIESRLGTQERALLDRQVRSFRFGQTPMVDPAAIVPPATTVAETQALLARNGYYIGPLDGSASPGLTAAAAAYLRDHPEAHGARLVGPRPIP